MPESEIEKPARVERLLNLLAALLATDRPLTREDLLERVPGYGATEAARRAFERDKSDLRQMGIPITVELIQQENPESPPGYRVHPRDYALPDPGLAPDELAALHIAATAVKVPGAAGAEALWKLGGDQGTPAEPALSPGTALRADLATTKDLPVLFDAVTARRTVTFGYRGRERVLDPLHLAFRAGRWYVTGHDHDRGAERLFRLDRMEGEVEAGPPGAFDRPDEPDFRLLPAWQTGDEEPATAIVRIDASHADLALAEAGEEVALERDASGAITLTLNVTNRVGLRNFVLGFLDHAELVAPKDMRADLVAWLDGIATRPRKRARR